LREYLYKDQTDLPLTLKEKVACMSFEEKTITTNFNQKARALSGKKA